MKTIILGAILCFGLANGERDWSNIKPADLFAPGFEGLLRDTNPRITGGDEVPANSIPYQAALFIEIDRGTAFCGGSVLSANYVLTAAHCVEGKPKSVEVLLGAHNVRNDSESTQQRFTAANIIVHPGWNRLTLANDIAVVQLSQSAVLNDVVQPVGLPRYSEASKSFNKVQVKASGWGKDSDRSNTISPVLRAVNVPVLGNLKCSIWYLLVIIQDTHICTDGKQGKSTCNGDSGGPIVVAGENKQIGLTSFGISLGCEIGFPPVFTRVSRYLDWLQANTDVVIQP